MLAFDNPVRRTFVNEMVPARGRAERRDALQRHGQHLAHRGPGPRRGARRDRRLRLVLHDRRRLLRDGAGRPGDDAPGRAAAGARDAPRGGPDPGRAALHRPRAGAVGHVRDAPVVGTWATTSRSSCRCSWRTGSGGDDARTRSSTRPSAPARWSGALAVARRTDVSIRTVAVGRRVAGRVDARARRRARGRGRRRRGGRGRRAAPSPT